MGATKTCEVLSTGIIVCVLVYIHVDSSLVQGCHALCSTKKMSERGNGEKEEGEVSNIRGACM